MTRIIFFRKESRLSLLLAGGNLLVETIDRFLDESRQFFWVTLAEPVANLRMACQGGCVRRRMPDPVHLVHEVIGVSRLGMMGRVRKDFQGVNPVAGAAG